MNIFCVRVMSSHGSAASRNPSSYTFFCSVSRQNRIGPYQHIPGVSASRATSRVHRMMVVRIIPTCPLKQTRDDWWQRVSALVGNLVRRRSHYGHCWKEAFLIYSSLFNLNEDMRCSKRQRLNSLWCSLVEYATIIHYFGLFVLLI
jgi:hypothetical protein